MVPTPFERVISQRPDPDKLRAFCRMFDRELPVTWAEHAVNRYAIEDGDVSIYLGLELERVGEIARYLATINTSYEGAFSVVLSIRRGGALPSDDGTCELGGVVNYAPEWYDFGADLGKLRDAGLALSWEAAQWLYAAGRDQLAEDSVYDELTPRSIKLALFHRPYTLSKKTPGRHLGTNGASAPDAEVEHPPVFLFASSPRTGTDAERANDRAQLARAIAGVMRHPDAAIDRLLRHELALIDAPSIDDELEAMWNLVLRLDPMIETNDPKVFELPPPRIESIHR
jgi:hypothetical protein